jgi:mannose-6-phosphate isomerase-like protein (cupin superfamily)
MTQFLVGQKPVAVAAGNVLHVPPRTEHEVRCDGAEELRYSYTAAPAVR